MKNNTITRGEAEKLIRLVDERDFVELFDKLDSLGIKDHNLNQLRMEFINGFANPSFPKRLKVYILSLSENNNDSENKTSLDRLLFTTNTDDTYPRYVILTMFVMI